MRNLAWCLLLFVACSSPTGSSTPVALPAPAASAPSAVESATPTAASSSAPAPVAPSGLCLPLTSPDVQIADSTLAGSRLTVCMRSTLEGAQGHPCLALDLQTRAFSGASSIPLVTSPEPSAPSPTPVGYSLRPTPTAVDVCTEKPLRCTSIKTGQKKPSGAGHGGNGTDALIAALSDDASKVAVLVSERDPRIQEGYINSHRAFVETYDVTSARRLRRLRVPSGDREHPGLLSDSSDYWQVQWLGDDHLLLGSFRCCGPAGARAILSLKDGAMRPLQNPTLVRRVAPDTWMLANTDGLLGEGDGGLVLTLWHPSSDKLTRLRLPGGHSDEPMGHDLDAHPWQGSVWALVHTSPPGVTWFDVAQEKVIHHADLPLCR